MEMLCSGSVSDLHLLIAAYQFPPDALFLGEIQPQHVIQPHQRQDLLRFAHFDTHIEFAAYTSGRIFHADFELRWQRASAKTETFRVVYLGAERSTPGLQCDRYLLECKEHAENEHKKENEKYACFRLKKNHYYLFGTRLDGAVARKADEHDRVVVFAEARIPHPLYYPGLSSPAERVQLEVREYCNRENGQVMWFRFAGLKAVEEQA
jgi:hypothetical protein